MKEMQLRRYATCSLCDQKIGHSGLPIFYRVSVEQYMVDLAAVQRQSGLTSLLGGSAELALAMGADEDIARRVGEPVWLSVCMTCATGREVMVETLFEHESVEPKEG